MKSNIENLYGPAGFNCIARMRRAPSDIRLWLIVLLVAAALSLASCGGSDDASPAPEIEVRDSGGNLILAATTFDFGVWNSPNPPITETFTINNLGDGALTINGTPTIGGAEPTFFSVPVPPRRS